MNLTRIRWGVRAVLALGIAASITGNVLHAQDNPISQAISAWPPAAFLITVELISRIPLRTRGLTVARVGATAVIAGIAAWVSYWHMAAVASRYGETGASPYLLPLSVDGLVVVASICLVELAGRIGAAAEEVSDVRQQDPQELLSEPGGDAAGSGEPREGRDAAPEAGAAGEGVREAGAPAQGAGEAVTEEGASVAVVQHVPGTGVGVAADGTGRGHGRAADAGARDGGVLRGAGSPAAGGAEPADAGLKLSRPRKPHTLNPQRVAEAHTRHPQESHKDLARRLKLSPATVKRYRPPAVSEGAPPKVNGHVPEFVAAGSNEEEN